MERLSRFSHTTDTPTATFDLSGLAANIASLSQRRVKLAGCRLETELPEQPVMLTSNPFGVQHALFLAIDLVAQTVEKGELVALTLALEGGSALSVSGKAPGLPDQPEGSISALSDLVNHIGGDVEMRCENGRLYVDLTFRTG